MSRGRHGERHIMTESPDAMGREMADGPRAVRGTLANVEAIAPAFRALWTDAARVVLVGMGGSLAVSRAAGPSWRRRLAAEGGRELIVRQSSDAALGDLDGYGISSTDLVVSVSQSGTTPETLAMARQAAATGAVVVALTAHRTSPLANCASLVVEMDSGEESDASTKSALAALAGLLAMGGVIGSDPMTAEWTRANLDAAIASAEVVEPAGRILADARRTWCLGFGSSLGIAEATALLWHEKVVRQAVVISPAEFRHGPIEAAGPGDAVVLVDVDPPNALRAAYLGRMRDELDSLGVILIEVPPRSTFETDVQRLGLPLTSIETGDRLLESLLRLQQHARAVALASGSYLDGFRVLRRIVMPADHILGPTVPI